jgi:hypothetical protein
MKASKTGAVRSKKVDPDTESDSPGLIPEIPRRI